MIKAKIFKPSKTAMQSGHGKTKSWVLEYEPASARTPERLMGWVGSEDTLNQVRLKFATKKDAIAFADKEGFTYTLLEPKARRQKPRNYGDNFKYIPVEEC